MRLNPRGVRRLIRLLVKTQIIVVPQVVHIFPSERGYATGVMMTAPGQENVWSVNLNRSDLHGAGLDNYQAPPLFHLLYSLSPKYTVPMAKTIPAITSIT
jgi:hypothetical protein